jgi:hypothetical protein
MGFWEDKYNVPQVELEESRRLGKMSPRRHGDACGTL